MTSPLLVDPAVSAVFVVSVITAPLCIVAAIHRFVAARRIGRRHSSEDWYAYGAVAIHLDYVSASIYSIVFLDNRPVLTLPPDELLYLGKLAYAVPPLFAVNQLLTKMSVLLFYHRTFDVRRGYRIGIYVWAAVVVAWFIAVLLLFLFSCRPISKGWDLLQPGTCLDYGSTVAGGETTNSAMDFVLVVQVWPMIRPLRMSVSTKWKLFTLFAAGALAGLAGFAKIFETYRTVGGAINYLTGFWAIIQMFFSIFCCCVMTYKPILPSIWAETKTSSPGLDEDRNAGTANGSLGVQQPNTISIERRFEVA
ncbi:hypothetical protein V8F06_010473 [Rhypophila decipiens]